MRKTGSHFSAPRSRADLLLVERGLFESRARAQAAIAAGLVRADGVVLRKASETVPDTAAIEAHRDYIKGETLAVELELVESLEGAAFKIEGEPVTIAVERIAA